MFCPEVIARGHKGRGPQGPRGLKLREDDLVQRYESVAVRKDRED